MSEPVSAKPLAAAESGDLRRVVSETQSNNLAAGRKGKCIMRDRISSRLAAFAGSTLLAGASLLGTVTPAFATDVDIITTVTTAPAIDPTEPSQVRPRVNLSTASAASYASYIVTFTPYTAGSGETFNPVYFRAKTTVVSTDGESESPVPNQVADFGFSLAGLPPSAACTVTNTFADATSEIKCKLTFTPPLVSNGSASLPFTLTVKAPTAGQRIKFVSETRWFEPGAHECGYFAPGGNFPDVAPPCLESEGEKTATLTDFDLLSPTANPKIAETVLPFSTGGTVTTGTGAATCANPWVTTVKVPTAATVSLNVAPTLDGIDTGVSSCAGSTCKLFAKVRIPALTFPPSNPLRITLRRDRCTIEGRGIIGKALEIFEEQIFYRKDDTNAYNQVRSCLITGGPTTGIPCIRSRGIYTIFNLPNVPDKLQYLGDHFWNIEATENGKYGAP